jgi:hypothetical protein
MSVLHPPCLPCGTVVPLSPSRFAALLRLWRPLRDALLHEAPPRPLHVRELDARTLEDIGYESADPTRPEPGRAAQRMPHLW